MASFRSKFQIPGFIPTKDQKYSTLLTKSRIIENILKQSFFWFPGSKRSQNTTTQDSPNSCRRSQPPCVELCKYTPSKCLENYDKLPKKRKKSFLSFRKEPKVVKEKPDNCKETIKSVESKLTLWEQIFGPDPKRFWPDPCTCRLAYRQKKLCQQEDPRLRDPRYQVTPGNVLLYTEYPRYNKQRPVEPQPKPPPSYKLPNAVLCKMAIESTQEV